MFNIQIVEILEKENRENSGMRGSVEKILPNK